jgi:hypothetical protein
LPNDPYGGRFAPMTPTSISATLTASPPSGQTITSSITDQGRVATLSGYTDRRGNPLQIIVGQYQDLRQAYPQLDGTDSGNAYATQVGANNPYYAGNQIIQYGQDTYEASMARNPDGSLKNPDISAPRDELAGTMDNKFRGTSVSFVALDANGRPVGGANLTFQQGMYGTPVTNPETGEITYDDPDIRPVVYLGQVASLGGGGVGSIVTNEALRSVQAAGYDYTATAYASNFSRPGQVSDEPGALGTVPEDIPGIYGWGDRSIDGTSNSRFGSGYTFPEANSTLPAPALPLGHTATGIDPHGLIQFGGPFSYPAQQVNGGSIFAGLDRAPTVEMAQREFLRRQAIANRERGLPYDVDAAAYPPFSLGEFDQVAFGGVNNPDWRIPLFTYDDRAGAGPNVPTYSVYSQVQAVPESPAAPAPAAASGGNPVVNFLGGAWNAYLKGWNGLNAVLREAQAQTGDRLDWQVSQLPLAARIPARAGMATGHFFLNPYGMVSNYVLNRIPNSLGPTPVGQFVNQTVIQPVRNLAEGANGILDLSRNSGNYWTKLPAAAWDTSFGNPALWQKIDGALNATSATNGIAQGLAFAYSLGALATGNAEVLNFTTAPLASLQPDQATAYRTFPFIPRGANMTTIRAPLPTGGVVQTSLGFSGPFLLKPGITPAPGTAPLQFGTNLDSNGNRQSWIFNGAVWGPGYLGGGIVIEPTADPNIGLRRYGFAVPFTVAANVPSVRIGQPGSADLFKPSRSPWPIDPSLVASFQPFRIGFTESAFAGPVEVNFGRVRGPLAGNLYIAPGTANINPQAPQAISAMTLYSINPGYNPNAPGISSLFNAGGDAFGTAVDAAGDFTRPMTDAGQELLRPVTEGAQSAYDNSIGPFLDIWTAQPPAPAVSPGVSFDGELRIPEIPASPATSGGSEATPFETRLQVEAQRRAQATPLDVDGSIVGVYRTPERTFVYDENGIPVADFPGYLSDERLLDSGILRENLGLSPFNRGQPFTFGTPPQVELPSFVDRP